MAEQQRRPNNKFLQELYAQNCGLVKVIAGVVNVQKQLITSQRDSTNFLRAQISSMTHLVEKEIRTGRELDQLQATLDCLLAKELHRQGEMTDEMFGGGNNDLCPNQPADPGNCTTQGSSGGISSSDSNFAYNCTSPTTTSQVT